MYFDIVLMFYSRLMTWLLVSSADIRLCVCFLFLFVCICVCSRRIQTYSAVVARLEIGAPRAVEVQRILIFPQSSLLYFRKPLLPGFV